jgi:hypothetical protein
LTRVNEIENAVNQPGEYTFEGYNIYQLPGRNSSLAEARRIATYDLPDDPTVVLDEQFDLKSGQILSIPVQFGANSGVTRYFKMNRDYILDLDKLYNGQTYYVAVTAYSVARQAGFLPAALESAPLVITVQPKRPFGTAFLTKHGDTLAVTHTGKSDGIVRPIVINPAASTGNNYEVRFDTTGGATTWKVVNTSTNKTVLDKQENQSGDTNYKIIEGGVYVFVSGPPPGVKDASWSAGTRFLTFAGGADGFAFEGFTGAVGYASPYHFFGNGPELIGPNDLKRIELRFAVTDAAGAFDAADPNASFGYRYLRNAQLAPAKPEFAPFIKNTSGTYAFQEFAKSIPLAAYDMDVTPPRRVALGYLENNVAGGLVDGHYWPPFFNNANNTASTGPREWLFVSDLTYSETQSSVLAANVLSTPMPYMYFCTFARRNENPWPAGNVMTVTPNRPNTIADVFKYTATAPEKTAALEQASANNIGVYPNPYYAFNPAETNRLFRFVTFNNLPPQATVRIFNLGGQLVRKIVKDDQTQFLQWDLLNHDSIPVASGMYIAHVEATLPSGTTATKVLKLAIIQEQEVLDIY